jgi:glycosyltransferase involved in cell wall biosynthesis
MPLELQVHTDLFSPDFKALSFGHWWRVQVARFLLPRAASVRVVSDRIKRSIARTRLLLRRPAIVLPIFVDTKSLQEGEPLYNLHDRFPQFSKIILMVGRLTKEKDYPLAFEVLGLALKSESKLGLVIAGAGPERDRLLVLAKSLGLDQHIIFLGWQTDLLSLYKTADVFLHTSRYEGYGLVLLEAAAAGLPVVSRPVGIMSEELGLTGETAAELAAGVFRAEAKEFRPDGFTDFESYAEAITNLWWTLL